MGSIAALCRCLSALSSEAPIPLRHVGPSARGLQALRVRCVHQDRQGGAPGRVREVRPGPGRIQQRQRVRVLKVVIFVRVIYSDLMISYAFITYNDKSEAIAAKEALNGQTVCGQEIKVDVAKPRGSGRPRGMGRGGEGGRGRGGGDRGGFRGGRGGGDGGYRGGRGRGGPRGAPRGGYGGGRGGGERGGRGGGQS